MSAFFLRVRVRVVVESDFHHNALFAHLQHHPKRVLLRVVQHFDELNKIRVVQLLHDGYLLADKEQGVLGLCDLGLAELLFVHRPGVAHARPRRPIRPPQDVGLRPSSKTGFGELLGRLPSMVSSWVMARREGGLVGPL